MAYQEPKDPLVLPVPRDFLGQWDQEVPLVPLEIKVKLDQMESLARWENQVLTVERAHLDHRDLWVTKGLKVVTDPKELKEDRELEVKKEAKDRLGIMERRAHLVIQAEVEEMEKLDHVAWMGRPVTLEHLEYKVRVVKQAHKASRE